MSLQREVYINNNLIDVNDDSVAGYIFTSPIFRDISEILRIEQLPTKYLRRRTILEYLNYQISRML